MFNGENDNNVKVSLETLKKFYFQKSDKGFKVYIGDASGAAKDSDEVEFSTTPASN